MAGEDILVVDDEPSLRYVLNSLLKGMDCDVTSASSGDEALALMECRSFALALLDIVLPGMSGLEVLGQIKERSRDTEVIMMTSHASLETAVEAIRKGAYDYLQKPFELDEASATIRRALEKHQLMRSNRELMAIREHQNRDLRAVVQRLRALNTAGIGISALSKTREILEFFVDIVGKELNAARVSIMLMEPGGDQMSIAASRGVEEDIVRTARVRRGEGVAGQVMESGQVMLVADSGQDERTAEHVRKRLAPSFLSVPIHLSVPIKSMEQVLGVVNVTNRLHVQPFGPEDAAFLSGLCGQLAVSIERSRQTERIENSIRLLQSAHERLIASERLNALGEMAAGVAHDFNNVLNGILGRSQLLQLSLQREAPNLPHLRSPLGMIETLARQGADNVRRIQDSARIRKSRATDAVDPNEVVRLVVELMRPHWESPRAGTGAAIEVVCELDAVPRTTGNTMELVQAFSNIFFNAIDAMPAGGRIAFRSSLEGDRIRIDISDTGVGISEEVRSKLFQAFHTTKPHGHGLGLSIVYAIVSRMGGSIEAEGAIGGGTTFTIRLPVRGPEAEVTPDERGVGWVPPLSVRVLVVEDEEYNREFYQECLSLEGHHVTTVENGAEAFAVLATGTFDLVITDLSMPGISGWDVAEEVKQRSPAVPVLMLSGWGAQMDEARAREVGVDFMLSKPVDLETLLTAVRNALHQGSRWSAPDRRAA